MPPIAPNTGPQIDEGADYVPTAAVTELSAVLGFVTEFNENVQIFNQLTEVLVAVIYGLDGAFVGLQVHDRYIHELREKIPQLVRRIEEIARQVSINRTADSPAFQQRERVNAGATVWED